jgi:LysM repeat protein
VQELAALNDLDTLHPIVMTGRTLKVAKTATETTQTAAADSLTYDSTRVAGVRPAAVALKADSGTAAVSPLPETKQAAAVAPDSSSPDFAATLDTGNRYHVLAKGDNLYRISLKYGIPVASLMKANHIPDASLVRTGDSLFIPARPDSSATPPGPLPSIVYYKVKDGDTLLRIAAQFGVPLDSLYKNNNLSPDTVLTPGKVIKVITAGAL